MLGPYRLSVLSPFFHLGTELTENQCQSVCSIGLMSQVMSHGPTLEGAGSFFYVLL